VLAGLAFVAAAFLVAVEIGAFLIVFVITAALVLILAAGSRRRRAVPK
jgi:hypothetical protein